MIYTCENCNFVFPGDEDIRQCPDCGKFFVRHASETEIADYKKVEAEKNEHPV